MVDGGNSDVPVVPEFRLDVSAPETCTKEESMGVFFEPAQENKCTPSEEQQDPVSIKSSDNFEVSLDTRNVHRGWYWAVFCVSLDHLDSIEDNLDRIIFDVTSKEMNTGIIYTRDYTCKTVIEKDEIRCLPRTKSARLKLHRQIEVTAASDLCISIKVQTVSGCIEDVSFDLNYFELACRDICSEDHVLWGEGKPDQFIRIVYFNPAISNAHIPGNRNFRYHLTALFRTTDRAGSPDGDRISERAYTTGRDSIYTLDQGHFHTPRSASTLSVAHIDVWDLSEPSGRASSDNPEEITTPLASWSLPMPALKKTPGDSREKKSHNDFLQLPKPTINISSTGLHIIMAVGWATSAVHAAPFIIFRRTAEGSEEQNHSVADTYKLIPKICPNLQAFFGYGAFHNADPDAPNCENERYFNFHGSTFDVYITNGSWKQLYSLTFGIKGVPHRPEDMYYLTQSLRGRYFAWTGDRGAVSIWDFETGKFVNTILVPNDKRGVCAALCEDGSMIAITVNGCIQLHDVVSGIKLGVHKVEWKEESWSEIIFRQDYFMALNAAESTSGKKNIDARSIFRVPDMKVVNTHHVFWQYAAEYASTLNPIFLYRQGAILNIKHLGNILCPIEDDGCTLDASCDFEYTEVNLSDNTWTDRDHPSAGTTFVLAPANSPSRPLSIMGINITNVYDNASLSLGPESESRSCSGFYMAISGVQSCTHGRKFIIRIDPIQWTKKQEIEDDQEKEGYKVSSDDEDYPDSYRPQVLTFPKAAGETFLASEQYRYEKGVASLIDTYADSDLVIKGAIIRFLIDRIPPSPKYSSSLVILCRSWKYVNRTILEEVITNLLPAIHITWIPKIGATKNEDPLSILLETAKRIPSVLGVSNIIVGYCVNQAFEFKNLSFLSPFLQNLQNFVALFPDEARIYLSRIAYFSVSDRWRDYVVEHSIVLHPPWYSIQFWTTPSESNDRVMQLQTTMTRPRTKAATFTRPIYVAAFDALWHYNDNIEYKESSGNEAIRPELKIMKGSTAKHEDMIDKVSEI
ncbi:hypothetical protein BGZ75_004222 [Mortierella antarctica]|nr:hypothetical protein BGZ75_004222 [Mortierella antarctica]